MRLPGVIRRGLLALLQRRVAERRPPDVTIGGPERPYIRRWWLIPRNRWGNIYLHHILRDGDDRALHDHPWVNCSVILSGGYREALPGGAARQGRDIHRATRFIALAHRERAAGQIVARGPRQAHRIILRRGPDGPIACWSLFLTGPTVREWGFHCPQGWTHWRHFTSDDGLRVGKGCEP